MPEISYLAKEGDIAPGTGGATFSHFGVPVANNNGEVLISAFLSGGTSGASEGLFVLRSDGEHESVALGNSFGEGGGTTIPNSGGSEFLRVDLYMHDEYDPFPSYGINDNGVMAFLGDTKGGNLGQTRGLWRIVDGHLGSEATIWSRFLPDAPTTPVPNTGGGVFASIKRPHVLEHDAVGFTARIVGAEVSDGKKVSHGIFRWLPDGNVGSHVLADIDETGGGTRIPGNPGASFVVAERPSFASGAGWVFNGITTGGTIGNTWGLWHGAQGILEEFLRADHAGEGDGSVVPETGGAQFRQFYRVRMFTDGTVGFYAAIAGGTVKAREGIFLFGGGVVTNLALADPFGSGEGSEVFPGILPGTTFLSVKQPAFNDSRDVVFGADTTGGALGWTRGLWGIIGGETKWLLLGGEGMSLGGTPMPGGGILRWIEHPVALTDNGEVVFRGSVLIPGGPKRVVAKLDTGTA